MARASGGKGKFTPRSADARNSSSQRRRSGRDSDKQPRGERKEMEERKYHYSPDPVEVRNQSQSPFFPLHFVTGTQGFAFDFALRSPLVLTPRPRFCQETFGSFGGKSSNVNKMLEIGDRGAEIEGQDRVSQLEPDPQIKCKKPTLQYDYFTRSMVSCI